MTIPIQVFENISNELSAVISAVLDDEGLTRPASLADVRARVLAGTRPAGGPLNRFSIDGIQALRDEIDALIDEYGADALAVSFQKPWASEALSRLMTAGMDDCAAVSLSDLMEATQDGLLADLIGEGEIDDDEAQTVVGELQDLIERHGGDALIEEFVFEV